MSEQKLTDWFPADVKPAHVGMYERESKHWTGVDARDYWDGKNWQPCFNGHWDGRDYPDQPDMRWRGLTEPADAAQ